MTLQLYQSKLCSYCNYTMNLVGDKNNGPERACCNREHSNKLWIFKHRIENLIQQFKLVDNKLDTGDPQLTKETFDFIEITLKWMKVGLRVDILNEPLQLVLKGKTCANITLMKFKIAERKQLLQKR